MSGRFGAFATATRPAEPVLGLAAVPGVAALITANVAHRECPGPVCIYLGPPRATNAAGDDVAGYEGNLRAHLSAIVETSSIELVCDWRGYVMLIAQTVSIGWSWTRIPNGALPIRFSAHWGTGAGDGSHRPTLFQPITTVGGLAPIVGTETFNIPNLAAGLTLSANAINANGEIVFNNAQGVTLTTIAVAQGDRVRVPAGSRTAVLNNTGAALMDENSGLIWDFSV